MSIYDLQQQVKVIYKGKNHKNERCFYAYIGDTIIDLIEWPKAILQTVRLGKRQNFTFSL